MRIHQTAPVVRAANRSRWLAEVAEALDHASQLASRLGGSSSGFEAILLHARIAALSSQVDLFRRTGQLARRT